MQRPPLDFQARIYTPHRIAAVLATLVEEGIAPEEVLAGSGLDDAMLKEPGARVSCDQICKVYRNALRLTPDPTIALRAGSRMRLTSYGVYGYALLSSPSAEEAIDLAVRYHRMAVPGLGLSFNREGSHAVFQYEVLATPDPTDPLYRFMLEFTFAAHQALAHDLYDSNYRFSAVPAAYPSPAHASAYRVLFHCPVHFDQPVNELKLDPARVGLPPRLPDPSTHQAAREMCQQVVAGMAQSNGIASMVRQALIEHMPWRFANLEAMARELSMEPRTLRRRLEAQNTSYREILAEVRRVLAIEYLRKTRMTNEEIASRLGYSDAANFRHAFVRWTGKSPQEYRLA